MAGIRLNLWTIVGGLALAGLGYLALQHFGYIGSPASVRGTGARGYTETYGSSYEGNVIPYGDMGVLPLYHVPSNSGHSSTIHPPG